MFFKHKNQTGNVILNNYVKFRSSIYGRVVLTITYLSVFFVCLIFYYFQVS